MAPATDITTEAPPATGTPAAKSVLVGVIGHVDHGKTTLVRALTGVETDRLAEEKRRGMSIVLGFAPLYLPHGAIDLVDMPGHERFVRTMVAGASGIDAVLLVVAATEGVKPQTAEHVGIARLLGVRRAVIAVSKCDLAGTTAAEQAAAAAQRIVAAAGIAEARVVLTAAPDGRGIDDLAAALAALLDAAPPPADHGYFHLPIDRVFAVPGFGTVVTGTLRRGRMAVGDAVEIVPGGRQARIRGLQQHGRDTATVEPGRRVAVNLRGVAQGEFARGDALATPGMLAASRWLDVALASLPAAPPLAGGTVLQLLCGTAETEVRLRLLDRERLDAGTSALAQLHAARDVAAPAQERFVLRAGSPPRTIAGGRILDPAALRRRRFAAPVLAGLQRLADEAPAAIIAARLVEAGHGGCRLDALARLVGHAPDRVRGWAEQAGAAFLGGSLVLAAEAHRALRRRVLLLLDDFHRRQPAEYGMTRDRLRRLMPPDVADPVLAAVVGRLAAEGRLVQQEGLLRASGFRPAAWRVTADAALARAVAEVFRAGDLAPPDPATVIGADPRRRQALRRLMRDGVLVETKDRVQQRAIVFHRDAVAAARARIAERLAGGDGFLVRDAGTLLGISRKFSVPLLEYFDRVRFTRRIGDRRIVLGRDGRATDGRDGAPAADAPRPDPLSASACRPPRRVPT